MGYAGVTTKAAFKLLPKIVTKCLKGAQGVPCPKGKEESNKRRQSRAPEVELN